MRNFENYRDSIFVLTQKEIKVRYKNTQRKRFKDRLAGISSMSEKRGTGYFSEGLTV